MDESTKQLVLLLVLTYMCIKSGQSELIVFPQDTEALVNHSTHLNCSTSIPNEQIHWYHYRVGENRTNYVYYKGEFNKLYADRYSIQINIDTRQYNLIIRSVQIDDAGRYVCQDDGGLGRLSSAELIVSETGPTCESSIKPNGLIGPNSCGRPIDELQLSCSVSYNGNIPPIVQWKMDGDDNPIIKGTTMENSDKRVKVNLAMKSNVEMNGVSFTCSLKRSHGEHFNCAVGPVKVNYAFEQPLIMNTTKGETITCSVNASVSCTYRWFLGNDSICPVPCNQMLTTNQLGDHYCEATCTMDDDKCIFVAKRIFVYENETSIATANTTNTLLVAILIPVVVILLIALCILLFVIWKVMGNRSKSAAKPTNAIPQPQENVAGEMKPLLPDQNKESAETSSAVPRPQENVAGEMKPLLPGQSNAAAEKVLQENVGIEMKPDDTDNSLTSNKQELRTKASKSEGRAIAGIAVLDDQIYVVSERSSEVESFDTKTLEFRNRWRLEELDDPWDMVSCVVPSRPKCLYIMSRKYSTKVNQVIRIDSDAKVQTRWSTGEEYGSLSITSEGNVIVTVCGSSRLLIYTPDGERSVVALSEDTVHPSHAIKLSNSHILISHGFGDDSLHRVCITHDNGVFLKNSFVQMDTPSYLAVCKNGSFVVADQGNSRICLLNSDLEMMNEIASKEDGLRSPQRICLDENTGKLFVADNEVTELKRRSAMASVQIRVPGKSTRGFEGSSLLLASLPPVGGAPLAISGPQLCQVALQLRLYLSLPSVLRQDATYMYQYASLCHCNDKTTERLNEADGIMSYIPETFVYLIYSEIEN